MEGKFQDQGQLDQELEEWLSPRGSQSVHGFLSEEKKQESIQTEDLAPEGARISNQAPEEETYTMVVVKLSDKVEGSGDDIDLPLCGGLYKEETDIVPWVPWVATTATWARARTHGAGCHVPVKTPLLTPVRGLRNPATMTVRWVTLASLLQKRNREWTK